MMIVPHEPQNSEDVAEHYDALDVFYRDSWGEHLHHGLWLTGWEKPARAVEQLIELVAAELKLTEGDAAVDVGCGYGGTSRWMTKNREARVTAFTVSKSQYDYAVAQNVNGHSPKYHLCPWEDNQLEDESADGLYSIECLAHVVDKEAFFRQAFRVLRPGKRAVVLAWLAAPNASRRAVKYLLEPICFEGRLAAMGSHDEYENLAEAAGFSVQRFESLGKKVRKTWRICARRLVWKLITDHRYRRELIPREATKWGFAKSVFRLLTAFYTGAMDYGLFVLEKPAANDRQLELEHATAGSVE